MDWTGGSRKRFVGGGNNATIQKQKAHFAKARAALHATPPSQRSFNASFEGRGTVDFRLRYSTRGSNSRRTDRKSERRHGSAQHTPVLEHQSRGHNRIGKRRLDQVGRSVRSPDHVSLSSARSARSASDGQNQEYQFVKLQDDPPDAINDEEKLLLARRRNLLARADWLGLSIKRPAQIAFASSHDKDNIGKRRRVRKLDRPKAAVVSQHVQALQDHYAPRDYFMSGALPRDDIEVRIGADAFASHTQQSRRSHASGHTSMQHPSTDVALLSEESMLPGDEDDAFAPSVGPTGVHHGDLASPRPHRVTAISPLSEMLEYVQHVPGYACMDRRNDRISVNSFLRHQSLEEDTSRTDSAGFIVPESTNSPALEPTQDFSRQSPHVGEHRSILAVTSRPDVDRIPDSDMQRKADEDRWRRVAGIQQRLSSQASMAAVRSSSLHLTDSERDLDRQVLVTEPPEDGQQQLWSTPKGAGTQASMVRRPQEVVDDNSRSSERSVIHSLSTSLQQIIRLAEQPVLPFSIPNQTQQDDELWKSFIIGSQSSSPQASPRPKGDDGATAEVESTQYPRLPSPSAALSGLGSSNQATQGRTDSLTEAMVDTAPRHERTNTAHRPILEEDDIEAVPAEVPQQRDAANIHAGAARVLDPKRFKRPVRAAITARRPSIRHRSRRKATRQNTTKMRSVYDLVDSGSLG